MIYNGEMTMKEVVEKLHQEQGQINLTQLTDMENLALNKGLLRLKEIGQKAKETGIRLLVDAEYTYMNPGISAAALVMMMDHNQTEAVVANTYQCYLKVRLLDSKRPSSAFYVGTKLRSFDHETLRLKSRIFTESHGYCE